MAKVVANKAILRIVLVIAKEIGEIARKKKQRRKRICVRDWIIRRGGGRKRPQTTFFVNLN